MLDSKNRKSFGFTLIELLVVIAIIGILAGVVLVSFSGTDDKAKIAKAQAELAQILSAIKQMEVETLCWPGEETDGAGNGTGDCKVPYTIEATNNNEVWDLSVANAGLTANPAGISFPSWSGPYLPPGHAIFIDPWGNSYFLDTDYQIDGNDKVVLGSFGPNGLAPNAYDADDVIIILYE